MESNTIAAVRDIFVIAACGVLAVLGIICIVIVVKLFRPLQETVGNALAVSRNLRKATGDIAAVSEETLANLSQTSRNAAIISENLKEVSEDLTETVRTARDAAKDVSETASKVSTIAETVSRFFSLGVSGSGSSSSSGAGTLLRTLRNVFGGRRPASDG